MGTADAAGMRRRYTREERDELIRAVTRRREPVAAAAARLGTSVSTAFRWLRAAAAADDAPRAAKAPTFVELVPASVNVRAREARLTVRVGCAEIEVAAGFDAALLRAVVAALAGDAP